MKTSLKIYRVLKIKNISTAISLFEREEFNAGSRTYRMAILQSILRDNNAFMKFHMNRMFTNTPTNKKLPVIPDQNTTSLTVALDIGNLLYSQNTPYAIGGVLALAMYSTPRNTQDVDMNVFLHISEMRPVLELLGRKHVITDQYGVSIPIGELLESKELIRFWWKNVKVELFPNSLPQFSSEAMKTKVIHEISGVKASFLSAESLILYKILLGRNKDWVDIERMIEVNYQGINTDYVADWIDRIFDYGSQNENNSMVVIKAKLQWERLISHRSLD